MNWNKYYTSQHGGMDAYNGVYWQQGYGLGGTFKKFWRWVVPIFKKHALPKIESGLEAIGQEGLSTVKNIAKDVLAGKNFKDSAETQIDTAVGNLQKKVEQNLEGQGIPLKAINNKRKLLEKTIHFKKKKKFKTLSKNKYQDIFS